MGPFYNTVSWQLKTPACIAFLLLADSKLRALQPAVMDNRETDKFVRRSRGETRTGKGPILLFRKRSTFNLFSIFGHTLYAKNDKANFTNFQQMVHHANFDTKYMYLLQLLNVITFQTQVNSKCQMGISQHISIFENHLLHKVFNENCFCSTK